MGKSRKYIECEDINHESIVRIGEEIQKEQREIGNDDCDIAIIRFYDLGVAKKVRYLVTNISEYMSNKIINS